jgi:hypothetical protein
MSGLPVKPAGDLASLAAQINQEHELAAAAWRDALTHARNAGAALIEAKAQLQHGQWGAWLAEHFRGSERSAQVYMKVARHWNEIEAKTAESAVLSIGGALAMLAEPKAAPLSTDELRRIAKFEDSLRAQLDFLRAQLNSAHAMGVHAVLGYPTWNGYVEAELIGPLRESRLARETVPELRDLLLENFEAGARAVAA